MALVMLPCDLPWWSTVHKKLDLVQHSDTLDAMLEHMQKIHDLCNVSLDPDDDDRTADVHAGLETFVVEHMTATERDRFVGRTIKSMARRAQSLKAHRPPRGLEFSLQQQTDSVEISYNLMAALLANGFFATFPKRTDKTHPTLQDFNFTHYFRNLNEATQQAKLRGLIAYFDWLDVNEANSVGAVRLSRLVMTGKQWLTIEDWLECGQPLCPLDVRHDGRIERTRPEFVQTMFVSPRLGADVLRAGRSQQCLHLSVVPEMLPILLHMEALEDNEAILVENARQMGRIVEPMTRQQAAAAAQQNAQAQQQHRHAKWDALSEPQPVSLVLMDAENYTDYPINQLEEDNILRELNKCLLAFRQKSTCSIGEHRGKHNRIREQQQQQTAKRFAAPMQAIVEGSGSGVGDVSTTIVIRQPSTSTKQSSYDSEKIRNDIAGRRAWLTPDRTIASMSADQSADVAPNANNNPAEKPQSSRLSTRDNRSVTTTAPGAGIMCGRRGRFIVLGSSGEVLPVTRSMKLAATKADSAGSIYSSCNNSESDDDDGEFLSACGSFDNNNGDETSMTAPVVDGVKAQANATATTKTTDNNHNCHDLPQKYAKEIEQLETRFTFAEKLRAALSQSLSGGSADYTASTDDDLTAGDENGSTGFVLREDSLDMEDCFSELGRMREKCWLERHVDNGLMNGGGLNNNNNPSMSSSSYSFSTNCSSELEAMYEQFSKWLEGDAAMHTECDNNPDKRLDTRDEVILSFANALLKRTLSESFVGVRIADGEEGDCDASTVMGPDAEEMARREFESRRQRLILSSRSLSLELQKQKHRIAAQLTHKSSIRKLSNDHHIDASTKASPNRSLRWSITPVTSQQTINCKVVTLKLQLNQAKAHRHHPKPNVRAVATGNWGCGHRCNGDVQLKLIVQWMAASVAGLPCLLYYTNGHNKLSKLDTICRVLLDRKWTVGELAAATLQHAQYVLEAPGDKSRRSECLFEKLITLY